MGCDMKIPYASAEGMLPQMKGKLTVRNEKSLCLIDQYVKKIKQRHKSLYSNMKEYKFVVIIFIARTMKSTSGTTAINSLLDLCLFHVTLTLNLTY